MRPESHEIVDLLVAQFTDVDFAPGALNPGCKIPPVQMCVKSL